MAVVKGVQNRCERESLHRDEFSSWTKCRYTSGQKIYLAVNVRCSENHKAHFRFSISRWVFVFVFMCVFVLSLALDICTMLMFFFLFRRKRATCCAHLLNVAKIYGHQLNRERERAKKNTLSSVCYVGSSVTCARLSDWKYILIM